MVKDVDKEIAEEAEEDYDEELEKMNEDDFINKFLSNEDEKDTGENAAEKLNKIKNIVRQILREIDLQRSKMGDIMRVLEEGDTEGRSVDEKLASVYIVHKATSDAEENANAGEWFFNKLSELNRFTNDTNYSFVPGMIREILKKTTCYLTPQDIPDVPGLAQGGSVDKGQEVVDVESPVLQEVSKLRSEALKLFEEGIDVKYDPNSKKSKLGFPNLGLNVKSVVMADGKRVWPCSIEGCNEVFLTSHTCDSHLNQHLGYEYGPCDTCAYRHPHMDTYTKHTCFAGLKTGGAKKPSRKRKATATVTAAEDTSEGPVTAAEDTGEGPSTRENV